MKSNKLKSCDPSFLFGLVNNVGIFIISSIATSQNKYKLLTYKTGMTSLNPFLASLQNSSGKKWSKKIQQDWSILQNNLPGKDFLFTFYDQFVSIVETVWFNGVT